MKREGWSGIDQRDLDALFQLHYAGLRRFALRRVENRAGVEQPRSRCLDAEGPSRGSAQSAPLWRETCDWVRSQPMPFAHPGPAPFVSAVSNRRPATFMKA